MLSERGVVGTARRQEGVGLVGLLLVILVLGVMAAVSIVAINGLSGTQVPSIPGVRTGSTAGGKAHLATVGGAVASETAAARSAAAAAERSVIDTAESAYFALRGCYTDANGLATQGSLRQAPAYWTVTVPAGSCPASYALVARGP